MSCTRGGAAARAMGGEGGGASGDLAPGYRNRAFPTGSPGGPGRGGGGGGWERRELKKKKKKEGGS